MKFKVDENLSAFCCDVLLAVGHDAMSVDQQGMSGHSDERLVQVCTAEGRAILTADLDFADLRNTSMSCPHGVVVLGLRDQSAPQQIPAVERMSRLRPTHALAGHIWLVDEQPGRTRPLSQTL